MRIRMWAAVMLAIVLSLSLAACRSKHVDAKVIAAQKAASAQLRTLFAAETAFNASKNHFACTLAEFGGTPGLLDKELSSGQKSGFAFSIHCPTASDFSTYDVWAAPLRPEESGTDFYCVDQTSVIRRSDSRLDDCTKAIPVD